MAKKASKPKALPKAKTILSSAYIRAPSIDRTISSQSLLEADEWVEKGLSASMISSMVASIRYDKESQNLYVNWNRGKNGWYERVPEQVARDFFNSNSPGTFVHQIMIRQYGFLWKHY